MKNNFHPEFKNLIESKRFFIPYSTSHISDLLSGFRDDPRQREFMDQDLNLLSELTENNCLLIIGNDIKVHIYEPHELFDTQLSDLDQFRNFNLDKLEDLLKETSEGDEKIQSAIKQMMDSLKKIPLDKNFVNALRNPESVEYFDTLLPGLKDNPTMEGFFKSFGEILTRMNESDDYKELRKITQGGLGIKRDKIFNSEDPYSIIESTYKGLNLLYQQHVRQDKHGPEWFNDVMNEYLNLDIHGYQEDRISTTKGRKETFRNTTEDAFHAGFASTCNFYVLNDSRAYHKTKKVYERLSLNTIVLKPDEFLNYYKGFLAPRELNLELKIPVTFLNTEPFIEEKTEDGIVKAYHLPYFVFDFFNKLIATFDDSGEPIMILLSRFSPTNKKCTYHFEIENLLSKLFIVLGEDTEKLGQIKQEEFEQEEWVGRKWEFDDISYRLACPNGHFQLYYDL